MIHALSLLLVLQGSPGTPLGVEFRAPPDWVPVEAPPLRAFAPPKLARGELLLLTLWPAERVASPDGFAAWFERKLAGPGETVLQQSPLDHRPANGLDVLTVTQRVRIPQGGQVVRVVYGIAAGDRVALAMLTSNQDQLVTSYAAQARGFFESLRFTEAAPQIAGPPAPRPAASPPERARGRTAIPAAGFDGTEPRGLFYRLQAGLGSTRMETQTRIFLPSRRLFRVYPFGGGDGIDEERCNPDMCGGYRIDGAWLTVRWDNGDTQRLSFARSGDGFTLDGDTFQPARGLGAAEAVGDWVNPGNAGNPFDTGLRLKADGSFEWKGGSQEATLRGHYELRGLTLMLHFADGTSKPYTLFAAGRTQPAGLISFDGSVYARR
jgi:hypothetical protein